MDVVAIVLEGLLGLMFAMAGIMKIAGAKMHVDNFNHWGLPQWFRVVTGLVELVGAAVLVVGIWVPSWAAWGGLLLGLTMLAGVAVHLRVRDKAAATMPAVVLLVLAAAIVAIQSAEFGNFPG
ncbi:DoxX family protein [Cohnella nanjingensis]|uniref:DoxX family protein n=1 Tax=Cohnella nanjingensis TaxID=1387779 RepID=A0A7X0RSE8_9BACL|nr:DoxX family protein [Cohnella nanjingensis]MBB6672681.1 DoxX family protein [Cohnella nanjingensis]